MTNPDAPTFRAGRTQMRRRTILRGGSVALALPFLDAMRPRRASAQAAVKRFIGFFMPNGCDPPTWNPPAGALTSATLSPATVDMRGFAAERIWPAGKAFFSDVTMIKHVDHNAVCSYIHSPAMSLSAFQDNGTRLPSGPTLDQDLAKHIAGNTPFRNLLFSNTTDTDAEQGYISFRGKDQPEDAMRTGSRIFDALFKNFQAPAQDLQVIRARRQSVLDWVKDDAGRLARRLGSADRQRIDQHLTAVAEIEKQIQATSGGSGGGACVVPAAPGSSTAMHTQAKTMIDLGVLALQCDLTRVLVFQYSNNWEMDFRDYDLPDGVADWSDHFLSHKLGDRDRATDLDGLPQDQAIKIANARVVNASRWKVRRFGYVVDLLKAAAAPAGNMLDETMVLYTSDNGDGDSHSRYDLPLMLAGRVGGFKTGRVVDARGAVTGAVFASILNYYGVPTARYGNPGAAPLSGL